MTGSRELHGTVICKFAEKILFVRKEKPEWSLPGGKVEANELPVEGESRESRVESWRRRRAYDLRTPNFWDTTFSISKNTTSIAWRCSILTSLGQAEKSSSAAGLHPPS